MVKRLSNGNLLVRVRAESDDGSIIGDAWQEISKEHPKYDIWSKEAERRERILEPTRRAGRTKRRGKARA